jgi:hypothetical protein
MYEPEEEPSFLSRYTVPLGVAVGLIVMGAIAFFAIGLAGGDDDGGGGSANNGGNGGNATPEASATPSGGNAQEQVIGAYVRNTLNMEYAGDCSTTVPGGPAQTPGAAATVPATPNRICSVKRGDREGVAGYVLGQPLSEPTRYIFLEQRGGQWQVTYSPLITPDTRNVPGIPWPLRPGAEVIVVGTGQCLNVREGPALNQAAVVDAVDGTRIRLASGPADSDNRQWWQVDGRSGWVTADYLRYPDAAQ